MIKIPVAEHTTKQDMADYVRLMLRMCQKQYVSERDIEVEHYDTWDFAKITVFKWTDSGSGCGTKEHRDAMWQTQKEGILDTFEMQMPPDISWRWFEHYRCYDKSKTYDLEDGKIPGVTFFIKTEALELKPKVSFNL